MRIIHFADNHLGAGIDRRQQDILDSFANAVDRIIALKPDLVINAGDLFDMVHPPNRIIAFAAEQLLRLGREAKIPTIIISGNHDAPKQPRVGSVLEIFKDFENICVAYSSKFQRFRVGECAVAMVPHCLTTEILKEELEKIGPDPEARYNVLVLHGVVAGMMEFQMADLSEQAIDRKYFERGFDYVALGHYHNYTKVAPQVYYSGSTERMSRAEAGRAKGFIQIDLDAGGRVIFHEIAVREMIDLPPVKAAGRSAEEIMAELEQAVRDQKPDDKIIGITLSDVPEETYRALPFDRIAALKTEAFALDIRFEKEEKAEESVYADLNLGRLDLAFAKFLEGQTVENLDKDRIKKIGLDLLRRAEDQDA